MSRYPNWTKKEINTLKRLYPTIPAYEISRRIGRPIEGIRVMASRLKLQADRTSHWTGTWKFLKSNPYLKLSNTNRAYLAGIIDGEGWIVHDARGFWRVGVGNTNKSLIDWLIKTIEYSTFNYKKSRNPKWKEAWQWFLHGDLKVKSLLELVLPYLIIKRDAAIKAICDIKESNEKLSRRND